MNEETRNELIELRNRLRDVAYSIELGMKPDLVEIQDIEKKLSQIAEAETEED